MKKEFIIIIFSILLIIPTISAIEITLSKQSYNPRETLQVEITGNFISLQLENILIYEKDKVHSTPVISDLKRHGDVYYFYAILPNSEGNYSLKIEDAEYTESGQTKTITITKDFTIQITEEPVLKINPGFIVASEDFDIKITSLNNNQEVSAELESTQETKTISLVQDSEKTLSFSVSQQVSETTNLKINDYNIPVFIIVIMETENGDKANISDQNQSNNQSEQEEPKEPKVDITNLTEEEVQALSCSDFGKKCESNKTCTGESESSLDGPCCALPGECVEKKQSNFKFWIGIIIIIFLVLIGLFFFWKTKRHKPKSTEQILKDKSKKFSERMKGKQVTGNVTRS